MAVPSALTPPSDASYLRRLLERQPACLIRVRLDGVLLACNDAALNLFGVGALRAVLNTNLTDRIAPAQRTKWQEFATRCWANGAASLECDLALSDDNEFGFVEHHLPFSLGTQITSDRIESKFVGALSSGFNGLSRRASNCKFSSCPTDPGRSLSSLL